MGPNHLFLWRKMSNYIYPNFACMLDLGNHWDLKYNFIRAHSTYIYTHISRTLNSCARINLLFFRTKIKRRYKHTHARKQHDWFSKGHNKISSSSSTKKRSLSLFLYFHPVMDSWPHNVCLVCLNYTLSEKTPVTL